MLYISNQGLDLCSLTLAHSPFPLWLTSVHRWCGLVEKTKKKKKESKKNQCVSAIQKLRTEVCGNKGRLGAHLLWEWEAFPAEVTFELGHLVFCRAAARFCLVWNKHIYKRIVGHIQLDGLDWWIESNSPSDGFVRCLFSENSACHSPSVNCGKEAVTLSCHSGYWGGANYGQE